MVVKNLPANAEDTRDTGSIPGLGRSPGGGNGNPLQYSCLENPTDRGAWWATVCGVTNSRTQLSTHAQPTWVVVHQTSSCHAVSNPRFTSQEHNQPVSLASLLMSRTHSEQDPDTLIFPSRCDQIHKISNYIATKYIVFLCIIFS